MEEEFSELPVDQTEEPEEEEQDLIRYQIAYYPSDITLKGYLDKWNPPETRQLVIPEFQRNYVWDIVQASKLIESFLLGIPVPGVFLYKERRTNRLQVIDGQQRILSVIRFFEGKFDDRDFRLKKVHPRWDGKTFEELDEPDRFQLYDSVLRATVVQQLEPDDDSSVYYIFERLNTGGLKLSAMEIRKCVYFSKFFVLLEELNASPDWKKIIGRVTPDKRLRDVEFILRFLAMRENWEKYSKPMKAFLNEHVSAKKPLDEEPDKRESIFNETRRVFHSTCKLTLAALGEKPFHLRGRLNLAAMDSVMTMMSFLIDENFTNEDLAERYKALREDRDFIAATTQDTSDTSVVKDRFRAAKHHLLKEQLLK
jgi:hypothetical protein